MDRIRQALNPLWKFCLDRDNRGEKERWYSQTLPNAKTVAVPHTYNVGEDADDYRGPAWYQYDFEVPDEWHGKRVRLEFHGVYRDANFWMNGQKFGKHYGAGFTTFTLDTDDFVAPGKANRLTVRVDNSYSPYALPWFNKFDWADDGGIFRPVFWLVTEKTAIAALCVDAIPQIESIGRRVNHAPATVRYHAQLCEEAPNVSCEVSLLDGEIVLARTRGGLTGELAVPDVALWHFDAPRLYTLKASVILNGAVQDCVTAQVGFRSLITRGNEIILNGESVRLAGTEWMPGSDPRIGNAERAEDIYRWLRLLKDSNCIFTRVHWQQDDEFFNWCDRHGMLVQEEIPLWGCPQEPAQSELNMAKAQLREMVASHYNHPSIISWGVGNELNGQSEITKRYVDEILHFCKALDPHRVVTYVSNTPWIAPDDATNRGDITMCNEYIGTWHKAPDAEAEVKRFYEGNSTKPMIISEFGLCEPVFPGGDSRRRQIFLDKIAIYRRCGLAGFIYFCLNDYRTQMGEDGEGRLRRRIHGSTDCYGVPKESYAAVRAECAPLTLEGVDSEGASLSVSLKARDTLPRYSVEGYYVLLRSRNGGLVSAQVPALAPGQVCTLKLMSPVGGRLEIYRSTGDLVSEADV